ncbi:MAG: OFA family MFS transporter [Deltaproteobacteria bacterium]|nr:OFA family MFS transporter [Deltaproteobacteria bacterium]
MVDKVPGKAWKVVFCGTAVNLCLGILYAWSVWAKALIDEKKAAAGLIMDGVNAGWPYLTNAEAATPFSLCVLIFALVMIPGGRIQDKIGPKAGAITGGLFLAIGCIIAGLSKSYGGLIFGFGIMGGIGMGIGYAAPTPSALSWFGPHKRGLVAGLVVAGYGGAALYISPLAAHLLTSGITYSFVFLGIFFSVVIVIAGSQLAKAPPGYVAPAAVVKAGAAPARVAGTLIDWVPSDMVKTPQFYGLVFMFIASTQSGLLVIANAAGLLATTAKAIPFFAANAWILASFGGLVQIPGRVCTGLYSDKIGRGNAYALNCSICAVCLFLMPSIIGAKNVFFLFLAVGIAFWQFAGGLALMPAFTADFFGPKNLGMNYGMVFIGWGCGFFMARLGGSIKDWTGTLDYAFYISAVILIAGVIVSRVNKRPVLAHE